VPLLTALLALFGMQATAETIDELYAKAKHEKTLVFYGAGPTGAQDRWINEFQQRFPGVKVNLIGGLSPALTKRVDEQLARRAVEVDLASLQTIQDFARWKQAGAMLLLYKPDGFDEVDPAYKDEDGAFTPVSINLVTYAYNTRRLAMADIPKSALDFLKPIFKGELVTTDPTYRRCRSGGIQHDRRQVRLGLYGPVHGQSADVRHHRSSDGIPDDR